MPSKRTYLMYIPEINSTNDYLKQHPQLGQNVLLYVLQTGYQTAGRGQQGNGWESERDKNLLFSLRYRPTELPAHQGFVLNEMIALAIVQAMPVECIIKWPNDIYIGDNKVAGILVENQLEGAFIRESILGVGINVNQTVFVSSAPNPTSLRLVTGKEYQLSSLLDAVVQAFEHLKEVPQDELHQQYMSHLYRRKGYYPYVTRPVDNTPTMVQTERTDDVFEAQIVDVTPQGELVLQTHDGQQHTYHFKQIRYVLPHKA